MRYLLLICFLLFSSWGMATHNRAGEITYRQIQDLTFEVTVVTFTNTKPTSNGIPPADRPEIIVLWGDNTQSTVARNVYYDLPDFYRKNIYISTHTFPGPGTYEILMEDPNRNEGVNNIANSVTVVFSIKSILQINPNLGYNNTPILLNPPVDRGAVNKIFIHNPAAFDPDGDSLSYEMTVCTGENGEPIETYELPASSNKPIYIDPVSGNLIWDTPVEEGAFNVAFNIFEWRQGVKIGQLTRDMQIEIIDSDNSPPQIDSIPPLCVTAGDTVNITVRANDELSEIITLSATGGVFEVDSPATFISTPDTGSVLGYFTWVTDCSHIRKSPYQALFKAQDNHPEIKLVDQQAVDIKILAPAPKNLSLNATNNSILLNWDNYDCANNLGFNIYRSTRPYGFSPDVCESGVPAYTGFELIASIDNASSTSFLDNNNGVGLPQGFIYCYLITAFFENEYESKASLEQCTELIRGTPIITHVSVQSNDSSTGEMYLAWSKPIDLDTVLHPGPYKYYIKRAEGVWGTDYQIIDSLNSLDDTIYVDAGINTLNQGYAYQVEIHNNLGLTELPMTASSIFPKTTASSNTILIDFEQNTPWRNNSYAIFRKQREASTFDSIASTSEVFYKDSGLINLQTYDYKVISTGTYDLSGITTPLINTSHQNSGTPLDTIAPQAPSLQVSSNCNDLLNTLSWELSGNDDDIAKYRIYYSTDTQSEYLLLDSTPHVDSLSYLHNTLNTPAACYVVTAVDLSGNESSNSNQVCIDICPYYELPNVFTPNGDLQNDYYIPLTPTAVISKYVQKIELKIYSRWGALVYETQDPLIQWDGKRMGSNSLVNPGVYYYVCNVFENRLSGVEERYLTGVIHIFHQNEEQTGE